MKKSIFAVVFVLLVLVGCDYEDPYEFPNKPEDVISIELLYNQSVDGCGIDEKYFFLIRTLNEEEILPFMNELSQLKTMYRYTGPLWGYGEYIARVSYSNGDVEMFGSYNIEYIANGDIPHGFSPLYFDGEDFEMLFSEYADVNWITID